MTQRAIPRREANYIGKGLVDMREVQSEGCGESTPDYDIVSYGTTGVGISRPLQPLLQRGGGHAYRS
jgi:hypothetical protein